MFAEFGKSRKFMCPHRTVRRFSHPITRRRMRFEGAVEMMQYRTEFAEDGTLNTLMFVPEDKRCEAAKHGAVVREDGYAAVESTVWKEENGKIYYDTEIEGEVLGEKVDSFAEIPVTEDGCLRYELGMIILERV